MASLRKHKTSKFWYACITLPDGTQRQFSTGLEDKHEAMAAATAAEREARKLHQTPHQLFRALHSIAERFTPRETVEILPWFKAWVESRSGTVSPGSRHLYQNNIRDMEKHLPPGATWDSFTERQALAFRAALEASYNPATVNVKVARYSAAWTAAIAAGVASTNPWKSLPSLVTKETVRREFRQAEIDTLLANVTGEWRSLTLLGLHTGQRLNDLATLRWSNIDLSAGTLHFTAAKTRALISLPLVTAAVESLAEDTPGGERPDDPVFPEISAMVPTLRSAAFRAILASCGLASPKTVRTGATKSSRRQTAPLSFHSLRHTFTTRLKSAGVADTIARHIVGHASPAVSRSYTHLDMDTMRAAIEKTAGHHA
jgi:integrase